MKKKIFFVPIILFISTFWFFNYKTPVLPIGFIICVILLIIKKNKNILLYISAIVGLVLGFFAFGVHLSYQKPIIGFGFSFGEILSEGDYALEDIKNEPDIEKKIKILQKSIEKDKKNYQAYNDLGWYLTMAYKFDEAVEIYEKALLLNPDSEIVKNNLILVNGLKDDNAYSYQYYGSIILQKERNYEQGISFLKKSLELNQIDDNYVLSGVYLNLGICYNELKEYEKALSYLENSIKVNPDEKHAHELINEIRKTINK